MKRLLKVLFTLTIVTSFVSCRGYKFLWTNTKQYETSYLDINQAPFIKVVFAQHITESTYNLKVIDRINNIKFDTVGIWNDTITEINYHINDSYKVSIHLTDDGAEPRAVLNEKTWLKLTAVDNKHKKEHFPYGKTGPLILNGKIIRK